MKGIHSLKGLNSQSGRLSGKTALITGASRESDGMTGQTITISGGKRMA